MLRLTDTHTHVYAHKFAFSKVRHAHCQEQPRLALFRPRLDLNTTVFPIEGFPVIEKYPNETAALALSTCQ